MGWVFGYRGRRKTPDALEYSGARTSLPVRFAALWICALCGLAACASATEDPSAGPSTGDDPEQSETAQTDAPPSTAFPTDANLDTLFVLPVPLLINGETAEQSVNVRINQEGTIGLIEKTLLVEALALSALPDIVDDVDDLEDLDGEIAGSQLKGLGLDGGFDQSQVAFVVNIPFERRKAEQVAGTPTFQRKRIKDPVVSAVVNAFAETGVSFDGATDNITRDLTEVDVNGALRIGGEHGVTFEGFATISENEGLELDDVRGTYDNRFTAIRVVGGDFITQTDGFQTAEELFGVSIQRQFELRPDLITIPRNAQTFIVERRSRVTILVDGIAQRELRLDPGRYSIADLSRDVGATDIEIVVDDGQGNEQRLVFSAFSGPGLLGVGVIDFGAAFGYRSGAGIEDDFADFDDDVISAFVRAGVFDFLTVGAGYQEDSAGRFYSGTLSTSGRYAGVEIAGAYSDIGTQDGFSVDGDLVVYPEAIGLPKSITLRASAQYASVGFQSFGSGDDAIDVSTLGLLIGETGDDEADNDDAANRWDIDLNVGATLSDTLRARVSANYTDSRTQSDSFEVRPSVQIKLDDSTSLRLTGSVEFQDGTEDYAIGAIINTRFDRNLSASASISADDTGVPEYSATLRRSGPTNRVGGYDINVSADHSDGDTTANIFGSYTANRFVADAESNVDLDDAMVVRADASVRLGASLVFADGHFAVGRPVTDAFAIVYPNKSLAGQRIEISPNEDQGPVATTDFLGPAVVPDITAYRSSDFEFRVDEVPLGVDLGGERIETILANRAGAAFQIGSDGVASAVGIAVATDGTPLALVAGQVTSDDVDVAPESAILFTNQEGRFVLPQLAAGTYKLSLGAAGTAELVIPEGSLGIVDVGKVRFNANNS